MAARMEGYPFLLLMIVLPTLLNRSPDLSFFFFTSSQDTKATSIILGNGAFEIYPRVPFTFWPCRTFFAFHTFSLIFLILFFRDLIRPYEPSFILAFFHEGIWFYLRVLRAFRSEHNHYFSSNYLCGRSAHCPFVDMGGAHLNGIPQGYASLAIQKSIPAQARRRHALFFLHFFLSFFFAPRSFRFSFIRLPLARCQWIITLDELFILGSSLFLSRAKQSRDSRRTGNHRGCDIYRVLSLFRFSLSLSIIHTFPFLMPSSH